MGKFNLEDYDTVETRLVKFWAEHPFGRIITSIHHYDEKFVVMKADIYFGGQANDRATEPATVKATGFAEEVRGAGPVNQTSHLENCETSAIGRALANCGYAGRSRPSREEMEKVARGQGGTGSGSAGLVTDTDPLVSKESVDKFIQACVTAGIPSDDLLFLAGLESLDGLRESGRLKLLDAFKVRKVELTTPPVADNIIPLVQPEKPVVSPNHPSTGFVPASDKQVWALNKAWSTQGLSDGEKLELAIARTGRLISNLTELSKSEASKLIADSKTPVRDSGNEEEAF